jgi:hypothetical protein
MMFMVENLSPSDYLRAILRREAVDDSATSVLRLLEGRVQRLVAPWGGRHLLEVYPTGAFEKGMANQSGMGIDFLLSLSPMTGFRMSEIYESLFAALERQDLDPVRRNVTISIVVDGLPVDLLPAKRESLENDIHELYSARTGQSFKTNLTMHVLDAMESGRREEVRILKLWRDQNGLDFPSFYLELATYAALRRRPLGELADNVWAALGYFQSLLVARGALDPANANNVVSGEMTMAAKKKIAAAAAEARSGKPWSLIIG